MDTGREINTAIWAITPGGITLGQDLLRKMQSAVLYLPEKEILPGQTPDNEHIFRFASLKEELSNVFHQYRYHIFIFSTGIAVRLIAPLLESKTSDPAVVVLDETGQYAISLVSGHLGGANDLARKIGSVLGAAPVITTATDINHLPSIDILAKQNDLIIETPEAIKHVNMKILKRGTIKIYDPGGHIFKAIPESFVVRAKKPGSADLVCTHEMIKVSRETLVLVPLVLSIGMGCNRGTKADELRRLITDTFNKNRLNPRAIRSVSTIDLKSDEKGLIELAEYLGRDLVFYSRQELNSVDTIQTPSKMAEKHIGVKSVCEAAAIRGAGMGTLIIPKQKTKNATLAAAMMI